MGREVLWNLRSVIVNDLGDPILNAAIMGWNATSIPWTNAWFDFPIFYPTRNALTFSEHLLGLTPLSTPLYWVTQDLLVTYNLVLLLTFPLCAAAMYVLVHRLTASPAAALVAGTAFAFAPYRMYQVSHLQMLAAFWMPLSILGLHEYLATRRRRWLVLFSVTFMLQGAANGYYLVFFSVFVGLWVLWFVILPGLWRLLVPIGVAILAAYLPLVTILQRYVVTHRALGFERTLDEVRGFSADVLGLLCADPKLSVWGTLQTGCKMEGALFPGATLALLALIALVVRTPGARATPLSRTTRLVRGALATGAAAYGAVTLSVWWAGPWRFDVGGGRISASSTDTALPIAMVCLLGLILTSQRLRDAVRTFSPSAFYAGAAVVVWLLALGPTPTANGAPLPAAVAPYSWLMTLPGLASLRVPSRFWMLSVFALAVLGGLATAKLVHGRSRRAVAAIASLLVAGLLADGWGTITVVRVPRTIPNPALLRGAIVLELPLGDPVDDSLATFRAVEGGWRTVNGYSGFAPAHYAVLQEASATEEPAVIDLVQQWGDLEVVTHLDRPGLVRAVASREGAVLTSRNTQAMQYRLPRRPIPPAPAPLGENLPISAVTASCARDKVAAVLDDDLSSRWECGAQIADQELTLDIGRAANVGAVVHALGPYRSDFPRRLTVETSLDGTTWEEAWRDTILPLVLAAAMRDPKAMGVELPFTPRMARFVKLRSSGREETAYWSVSGIQIREALVRNGASAPAPPVAVRRREPA